MEILRYVAVSLALGFLAVWASENMFWFLPPPDLTVLGLLLTWLAYSVCAAAAVSAVLWSGSGGWPAAFLGGAILGYIVEGVVVATVYDNFPWQLAWTSLAWHGLLTGGVVLALGLSSLGPRARAWRWLLAGVGLGLWGVFWPLERQAEPDLALLLVYLALPALGAILAFRAIRWAGRPTPPRWVLWVAPALALALALFMAVAYPNPLRLILPLILGGLYLTLRRSGPGAWPQPVPLSHDLPVLILPLAAIATATALWITAGAFNTSLPLAVLTSVTGLLLLGRQVWRARGTVRPSAS